MVEISLDFMNKLASQTIFISALLSGFSLTVLVLLLDNKSSSKLMANIFRLATVATGAFLITIFAMTRIFMMTTEGFPFKVEINDLLFPRIVGMMMFVIGIIALILVVTLLGWTKSKTLGRFTTVVGIITLILALLMLF